MTRQELQILQGQLRQRRINFESQFEFFYGKLRMADGSIWRLDCMPDSEMASEDYQCIKKCIGTMEREVVSCTNEILATVEEIKEKI